jgi:hypothetical protein
MMFWSLRKPKSKDQGKRLRRDVLTDYHHPPKHIEPVTIRDA